MPKRPKGRRRTEGEKGVELRRGKVGVVVLRESDVMLFRGRERKNRSRGKFRREEKKKKALRRPSPVSRRKNSL